MDNLHFIHNNNNNNLYIYIYIIIGEAERNSICNFKLEL